MHDFFILVQYFFTQVLEKAGRRVPENSVTVKGKNNKTVKDLFTRSWLILCWSGLVYN